MSREWSHTAPPPTVRQKISERVLSMPTRALAIPPKQFRVHPAPQPTDNAQELSSRTSNAHLEPYREKGACSATSRTSCAASYVSAGSRDSFESRRLSEASTCNSASTETVRADANELANLAAAYQQARSQRVSDGRVVCEGRLKDIIVRASRNTAGQIIIAAEARCDGKQLRSSVQGWRGRHIETARSLVSELLDAARDVLYRIAHERPSEAHACALHIESEPLCNSCAHVSQVSQHCYNRDRRSRSTHLRRSVVY